MRTTSAVVAGSVEDATPVVAVVVVVANVGLGCRFCGCRRVGPPNDGRCATYTSLTQDAMGDFHTLYVEIF